MSLSSPTQSVLPRWRGFNLLNLFTIQEDAQFKEDDYKWISEWGFDFVRIPMTYEFWIQNNDVYQINEQALEKVDRAVQLGEKYGIHVCLNLHRAPGYCVNPGRVEPFDLWKDQAALEAFCYHWQLFAERYQGISSKKLSFDLVNEPPGPNDSIMTRADYERVVRAAVKTIRNVDADRLIIADGVSWGNEPCPELKDLSIAQSCRAYAPMGVSHYQASWINRDKWSEPVWPGTMEGDGHWDRSRLEKHFEPWIELARQGVGVHCGEGGAFNQTPHSVVLDWFSDVLDMLTAHNIGYSVWNFRGPFGILDSGRKDVDYEDWHGHLLDRKLLQLLQKY